MASARVVRRVDYNRGTIDYDIDMADDWMDA
jgi:hypothetical protein